MSRKTFLTFTAFTALAIGTFAILAPGTFLAVVKGATPSLAANVMTRTVGVLLVAVGLLDFLVRAHPDSPTLKAVLIANLVLQLAILPIDPSAYAGGAFTTLGSFVPNTLLHIVLIGGFSYYLACMRAAGAAALTAGPGRGDPSG